MLIIKQPVTSSHLYSVLSKVPKSNLKKTNLKVIPTQQEEPPLIRQHKSYKPPCGPIAFPDFSCEQPTTCKSKKDPYVDIVLLHKTAEESCDVASEESGDSAKDGPLSFEKPTTEKLQTGKKTEKTKTLRHKLTTHSHPTHSHPTHRHTNRTKKTTRAFFSPTTEKVYDFKQLHWTLSTRTTTEMSLKTLPRTPKPTTLAVSSSKIPTLFKGLRIKIPHEHERQPKYKMVAHQPRSFVKIDGVNQLKSTSTSPPYIDGSPPTTLEHSEEFLICSEKAKCHKYVWTSPRIDLPPATSNAP